uniref:Antitoxin Phd_YefM, type II toxin-antitoxin system n=1 Tax=Candidatus Kentrum sp. FW TaxID=2126338 RepID=A0A450RUE1_9GAMM|nr:MAG: Antitoxin Phd_YefM, type II toxin-antitoxin system [Candidatus Kentron sp. FW]
MRENFDSYLRESKGSPVFVVEDGQPVAVLLPVSEKDDMERISLTYSPEFRELIDGADKRVEKTGGIGHNDFWESV